MLILTFNNNEENAVEKVIAAPADEIEFEVMCSVFSPMLSFSGLEIRQLQKRLFRNGIDISLTRLGYGTLVFLHPIQTGYSRNRKSLKLFRTWISIAVIQAL